LVEGWPGASPVAASAIHASAMTDAVTTNRVCRLADLKCIFFVSPEILAWTGIIIRRSFGVQAHLANVLAELVAF
jgi:hypothetical protein